MTAPQEANMTTLQEAARKALACLELYDHEDFASCVVRHELRTALAQQKLPQKERPDFMAGYDAGMADAKRMAQQGAQQPVAYITDTEQGPMVWTPEMYNDACTYCDDGEFPVPLYTAAPAPQQQESVCPECHCHFVGSDVTAPGSTRLVNTAPQSAQGGSVRVVSVDQLSLMFRNTNTDKDQWGHYHAKGWNDALRQAMDYAALQSQAEPMTDPCKTCSHFKEGNLPGVRIHDETCYECRSYWGNKWEAA